MSSRYRIPLKFILSGALIAMGASSCWLRTGAAPQSNASLQLGLSGCLDGASNTLGDFLNGTASEQEITGLWNCAYSSLQMFEERTTGANPDIYTRDELKRFLERYFLHNFKIPDGLMNEAMELKVTLIGGTAGELTKEELTRLRQLMATLRDQSIALRRYLPLIADHINQNDRAYLEESIRALKGAGSAIGETLQRRSQPYAFSHLSNLLFEIESSIDNSEYRAELEKIRFQIPFYQQLKKIFVSPDPSQMAGADWKILLNTGLEAYSLYLRYSYAWNHDPSMIYGQGLSEMVSIADDAYGLFTSVMAGDHGLVAFSDIDQIIELMDPSFFSFGEPYRHPQQVKQHVEALVPVVARKFLHDGSNSAGITQASIDSIWKVIHQASTAQSYIELLFEYVGTHYGNNDPDPLSRSYPPDKLSEPTLQQVFGLAEPSNLQTEMGDLLHGMIVAMGNGDERPLFRPSDTQISFNGYASDRSASFEGLSIESGIRVVVDLAYGAYVSSAGSGDPDSLRATVDEIGAFNADFEQLGIDLKLFDPYGLDDHVKRFTEGDLFTYASNGDGLLSAEEATDLVSFLFSSKTLSARIRQYMDKACPQDPNDPTNDIGTDLYGYPKYRTPCYEANLFDQAVPELWDHFPRLQEYYAGLPSRQGPQQPGDGKVYRQTFMCLVEAVSRVGDNGNPPDPKWFESEDTDGIATLMHYLEGLLERFDQNGDGFLNQAETRLAFPVLKHKLDTYIHNPANNMDPHGFIRSDDDYFAVLTYLLAKGQAPGTLDYLIWRYITEGDFKADRARVLQIMGLVSEQDTSMCFPPAKRDEVPPTIRLDQ